MSVENGICTQINRGRYAQIRRGILSTHPVELELKPRLITPPGVRAP